MMIVTDAPPQVLSPRELARALGVSESSIKRWVDDGALNATRTTGGHRRIPIAEAIRFIRRTGSAVASPEVLTGSRIPAPGLEADAMEEVSEGLERALVGDQPGAARAFILSLYVTGWPLASIFDGPMCSALTRIGELWQHSTLGVVVEHRAADACLAALRELNTLLPLPEAGAPVALGGAPAGDPYLLPSLMASIILTDEGFNARNLGPDTPTEVLLEAARLYRPKLTWLSSSSETRSPRTFARGLETLAESLSSWDGVAVIGGRAAELLTRIPSLVHQLRSMAELAAFARGLRAAG